MENPNPTTPEPKKKSFFRKPLGCLLTLVIGGLLFLILLGAFILWFAGSAHALTFASTFVNDKSGGTLTFAENDTNLFDGRVHWKGVELTNPSRFTDKGFVKINELKAVVSPGSAFTDTIIIPELIVDIDSVSWVGSDDWMKDSNVFDFKKAFVGEAAASEKKPEDKPAETGPKKHFRIGKLVLKLDRIRVLKHATTAGEAPKVVVDQATPSLNWEFTDVSDENIKDKVYSVVQGKISRLGGDFAQLGVALGTAMLADQLGSLGKQGVDLLNKGAGEATKAVGDVTKSLTEGIGGILGGNKEKESK